ncbi:DNA methyltransferase [Hyphobacterium sp. HN65]|uniref:Methyltransferase n=1 Tax=Hyphobacterium lacteum TaxID=3116575 RepID=A0ABU7LPL0_9PROT|nr:DNA methyltransferase [Hyphobacterium sp. HN65]MEE2525845.1 DNA methyltransferase [Hyphobacterium sp. HN65]
MAAPANIHRMGLVRIDELEPFQNHARKHDAGKQSALRKSIEKVGLIDPIIIDENNVILSGHLRVQVCKKLGRDEIDAVQVFHLSEAEKRAFVISANRLPERGKWDDGVLKLELAAIMDMAPELEIELTGFEVAEIDFMFAGDEAADSADDVEYIPPPPKQPASRPGDLWKLDDHLVFCGSSLEETSWRTLMGPDQAILCFTDPPYNVPIKGHVSSKDNAEFAMASGEMSKSEFTCFLATGLSHAATFSKEGALHYICMDHRHLRELYAAADPIFSEQLNLIVWNKTNAGMGSFYRSRHELIALFKVGNGPHINNVQLGKYGRNRSNVWTYQGANAFHAGRDKDLADHPTVKPTKMIADAILDASRPNEIIIDGFAGSGSTLLAAEKTGRRARVIELEPAYVDVILKRWSDLTGRSPELVASANDREARWDAARLPAPSQKGGLS